MKYTVIREFNLIPYRRPIYRLDEEIIYMTGIPHDFEGNRYKHVNSMLYLLPGFRWDGATGGLDYKFMKGSAIHDALCDAIGKKKLPSKYQARADQIMREVNQSQGMFKPRSWLNWSAVRLFQSVSRWNQKRKGRVI